MKIKAFIYSAIFLSANLALAQMNKTTEWQAGPYYGPLISTNTPGVSDPVPMYSIKINKGMSYYRPEVFLQTGSVEARPSNKINYNVLGVTFKNYLTIEGVDEILPFLLTGLQLSKYDSTIIGPAKGIGFHLGFGFDYVASKNIQIRNDYMLCNGPGRFLLVNIGMQFSFGGAESNSK